MMFLNPLVLLAMAAASIPILLHLLNLRQRRPVEFSTLRFLKELQKSKVRRVQVQRWLLLLLRIGLVVFAVLAFARPVLQSSSGLPGARSSGAVVIILDNSLSMNADEEDGRLFDRAVARTIEIIEGLSDGDQAVVVPLIDPGRGRREGFTRDLEQLITAVRKVEIAYGRPSYVDAINVALSLLTESQQTNREIFLVTDAQRINTEGLTGAPFVIDRSIAFHLLPIGEESQTPGNLVVDSILLRSSILESNRPVTLRAFISNKGDEPVSGGRVSMIIGSQRIASGSVELREGSSTSVDLTGSLKGNGFIDGRIELEGDRLSGDNRHYFTLRIIDGARVAVAARGEDRALAETILRLTGTIRPEFYETGSIGSIDLSDVSAVMLIDPPDLSSTTASQLYEYVESGGGLVLWGGPALEPNRFNAEAGPSLRFSLSSRVDAPDAAAFEFSTVDRGHPLFAGVFDGADSAGRVESPLIASALPATTGDPIITMTNGMAFMVEAKRGRGRIVYIAVPPSSAWSDLPQRSIFVPIMLRSALYVGAGGELYENFTVGGEAYITLPSRGLTADQARVTTPDGTEMFVPIRAYETTVSLAIDRLEKPGIYTVAIDGREVVRFAANVDPRESDLHRIDADELGSLIAARMDEEGKLSVIDDGDDVASSIARSRIGLELWRYFLALALICAFVEMYVARGRTAQKA